MQEEHTLLEIAKLIGTDALSESQQKLLAIAKKIRLEFLQQNAYSIEDTYTSIEQQFEMMKEVLKDTDI